MGGESGMYMAKGRCVPFRWENLKERVTRKSSVWVGVGITTYLKEIRYIRGAMD